VRERERVVIGDGIGKSNQSGQPPWLSAKA
jgi:hypothetical protein